MAVNYGQRISEANRAITNLKFTLAANALTGALAITQIVISALALAGYVSVNTLASLNIATVSLIIIVPALGLKYFDRKTDKLYEKDFFIYLILSIFHFVSFIFANAYAMTGRISLQPLACLSFCSPIVIMMVIAPCAICGMSLDLSARIDQLRNERNAHGHLLFYKERMKRLILSGATDPRSQEHEAYQQALADFPNNYPGGVESIYAEIRKEQLIAAWQAWQSNVEDSGARARFHRLSEVIIEADGENAVSQIIEDLHK